MATDIATSTAPAPPVPSQKHSRTPSPPTRQSSHPSPPALSLHLSTLPPLITPSPPSNTLLITNLLEPSIFHPVSLQQIRDLIDAAAPLHSFAPLKSLRRIVCSFFSAEDAVRIRQLLDGEPIMGCRTRVYFGAPTPVDPAAAEDRYLAAPANGKMFFISPPPSPPHGWEMRNEGPPNKEVHADDLASALAGLHARRDAQWGSEPVEEFGDDGGDGDDGRGEREGRGAGRGEGRERTGGTTVVYHPGDHGPLGSRLPAVMVEDTTGEGIGGLGEGEARIMAHTSRPPVELMNDT